MDIINTAALASLSTATSASAVGAASATAAPDALAAARFAETMSQPLAAAPAVTAANFAQAAGAAPALQPAAQLPPNASVGDRILNGMENVSEGFRNSWDAVNRMIDSSSMQAGNVQDMLKLQLQLTQVTFEYDLVGKAVTRSTQNIDQLVRVQ